MNFYGGDVPPLIETKEHRPLTPPPLPPPRAQAGLRCFQRGSDDPPPPGCAAGAFPLGYAEDFCYDPAAASPAPSTTHSPAPSRALSDGPSSRLIDLAFVGNNGEPVGAFPLGACRGDCDTDAECQVRPAPGAEGCRRRNTLSCNTIPSQPVVNEYKPWDPPLKICLNSSSATAGLYLEQVPWENGKHIRHFKAVPMPKNDRTAFQRKLSTFY